MLCVAFVPLSFPSMPMHSSIRNRPDSGAFFLRHAEFMVQTLAAVCGEVALILIGILVGRGGTPEFRSAELPH